MKELIRANILLRHVIDVYLRSATADSGPPLGTILGNLGINTAKFCKDFNEFTKELPPYFVICVRIFIYENRTFSFLVLSPVTMYILSIIKFQKSVQVWHFDRMHNKNIMCVNLFDLLKLCRFKFSFLPLSTSLKTVWSTVNSFGLKVVIF